MLKLLSPFVGSGMAIGIGMVIAGYEISDGSGFIVWWLFCYLSSVAVAIFVPSDEPGSEPWYVEESVSTTRGKRADPWKLLPGCFVMTLIMMFLAMVRIFSMKSIKLLTGS
jgi:hypothetical protein